MTLLISQLILNACVNAALFSLLAVGFGLVYRAFNFFYMAYGAVFITGAYGIFGAMHYVGMSLFPAIAIGLLAGTAVGLLMDHVMFLPLERINATSSVLFVASLGAYIILLNGMAMLFGNDLKTLIQGVEPAYSFGPVMVTRIQLIQFVVGCVCVAAFGLLIRKNTLMKGVWAMGQTRNLILVLGMPYRYMRLIVYFFSSLFVSCASVLTAMEVGIEPYMGMQALLTGAVAVIVGGVDVFWGWVGGAVLLSILQSLAAWQFSSKWSDLITFSVLILILLLRPQGLFSPKKRREER